MTGRLEPRAGTKVEEVLTEPGDAVTADLEIPLFVARGAQDGPTVAVLGGVHGDEYEGIVAAAAVWRDIDVLALRGRVLVVPVANPGAFEAGRRTGESDGRDLARTFPGRVDGTLTERIAHCLTERVIRGCDYLIDLHGAGQHYAMPLLCGSYAGDDALGRRCEEAALAFGAPVYWAHPTVAPGRSLSAALELDIPCLYAECGGGGRVRAHDLHAYRTGVQNVLAHAGLLRLDKSRPARAPQLRLRSSGDLDRAITTSHEGLLVERARLLERVEVGQPLADVVDVRGHVLETIRADRRGVVVLARRTARVRPGDATYMVATEDHDGADLDEVLPAPKG